MTNDKCHPKSKSIMWHMYITSYGKDNYWDNIHRRRLRHTPLGEVMKHLLIGSVKKKLFH